MDERNDDIVVNNDFEVQMDAETQAKFAAILNEESLVHASCVAHEANNIVRVI